MQTADFVGELFSAIAVHNDPMLIYTTGVTEFCFYKLIWAFLVCKFGSFIFVLFILHTVLSQCEMYSVIDKWVKLPSQVLKNSICGVNNKQVPYFTLPSL